MSFWRLKGSITSRWFAASLVGFLLAGPSAAAQAGLEESHGGVTIDLAVTLSGITSFQDFQELRAGLFKSEGVSKVALVSEAPGLITFNVTYAGEAVSLIDKLSAFFPKKYNMKEKRLPGGGTEVSISLKGV